VEKVVAAEGKEALACAAFNIGDDPLIIIKSLSLIEKMRHLFSLALSHAKSTSEDDS
jgi:hypothetical protein